MDENQSKVDTRSTIAILLAIFMVLLTGYLAVFHPDSDVFKQLVGFMQGTGFAAFINYYFGSSSDAAKKDAAQAKVMQTLAGPETVTAQIAWWSMLSDEEKAQITAAGAIDGTVKTFIAKAAIGKASPADLAYIVSAGLLTQARADAIQST